MRAIVLIYGFISGAVVAVLTAILLTLVLNKTIPWEGSQLIGYSAMVLSFLAVFFGIRAYRDRHAGGTVTFGKAFQVGILITLISCAVYVIGWEIVYYNFLPDFADTYATHVIEKLRATGADAAAIAAEEAKMAQFKELYANPFYNVGITFLEVFPVGLIMTLVSAAILRRRKSGPTAEATALA